MYSMSLMCFATQFCCWRGSYILHLHLCISQTLLSKATCFKIHFFYLWVIHVIIKLSVFDLHVHSYCTRNWQMMCFLAYLINTTVATYSPASDGPKQSWNFCLSWGTLLTSHLGCGEDWNHFSNLNRIKFSHICSHLGLNLMYAFLIMANIGKLLKIF